MTTPAVSVYIACDLVIVDAPYDPDFPAAARDLNGRFNRPGVTPAKVWSFDLRDEARVRELCRTFYGTDGTPTDGPTVTVRLPVASWTGAAGKEFRAAGRRLLWRPARDTGVRYADGVVLVQGGFPSSGGSVANPRLEPNDRTVIELRDLPLPVAELMVSEVRHGARIVNDSTARRDALTAERDTLLARLAQIDAALAELDQQQ